METLEVSGKTVEEAVDLALEQLGLELEDVTVEVLQEGKRSILGWGGEEAVVKVTPLTVDTTRRRVESDAADIPVETIIETAKDTIENLLSLMDVDGTVKVIEPEDDHSPVSIQIDNDNPGILIGRRGQSLSALQYMVNFISSRKLKAGVKVILDVADYRKRRQDELINMALRIAELVRTNGRSITLEPMVAWERRAIHMALRDDTSITTGSVGFGDRRKVVVSPKRN